MSWYEVQGRRMAPDRVRLASTENREAAFKAASEMAADGFTVWVFQVDRKSGRTSYRLLTRTT